VHRAENKLLLFVWTYRKNGKTWMAKTFHRIATGMGRHNNNRNIKGNMKCEI